MTASIPNFRPAQPEKICEFPHKQRRIENIEGSVTKRVRVAFEFTPVPEFIEREIETPALEKLYRILLRMARRGISDPSLRVLAKAMKRSLRMVQRYIRGLVMLGKLVVQVRRVTRDRNDTNVYILPDLQRGVGDRNVVEKLRAELKTTTPAPEARVGKFWEARFAQDREDSNWRREQYQRKASFWEAVKGWRLDKALERTRRAVEACVGISKAERFDTLTAEEEADFDRQMAELDAKRDRRLCGLEAR